MLGEEMQRTRTGVGSAQLGRFVQEVLNDCRLEAIPEIFAPTFRDNHPLRIPGLLDPPGKTGSVADLRAVVNLLASPVLDMGFIVEDLFEVEGRVAYRLFGQGTVALTPNAAQPAPDALRPVGGARNSNTTERKFDFVDSRLGITTAGWPEGKILGDRAVVRYSCVGIFHVLGGQLAERWGPEVVE